MPSTKFRFYDYRGSSDYKFTATFTVSWAASGNTIKITGITYNKDANISGWYVGSGMRIGVKWTGDANPTTITEGSYNITGTNYRVESANAGFVTVSGVTGIFTEANSKCPISKTFTSGSKAGFTMYFGSTRGTINYGNPGPYREASCLSPPSVETATPTPPPPSGESGGDVPEIEIDYRPGERLIGSWVTLDRDGGSCERNGGGWIEMRTVEGVGDPPEILSGSWKNQYNFNEEKKKQLEEEKNKEKEEG